MFIGHAPSGRFGSIDWGAIAPGGRGPVPGARRPVRRRRAGPRPVDGRPAAHRDREGPLGRGARPDPRRADGVAVGPRGRAAVHDRPPAARPRRRRSCSSATASTRSSTLCDRATVFRDGRHVVTTPTSDLTTADLVRHMVGRAVSLFPKVETPVGDVLLEVEGLTRVGVVPRHLASRSAPARSSGSPGLVGAGRTEVARVLFGIDRRDAGEIRLGGKPVDFASPSAAMDAGHRLPARGPPPGGPRPRLLDRPERDPADPAAPVPAAPRPTRRPSARSRTSTPTQFNVRMTGVDQLVGALSGGNQQKVVLAKWLASKPRVLILDEPTRGIDIGAKVEVHRIISELAASGLGIILISSDLPEVLAMSDRILVLHEGRITAEIPHDRATEERVMFAATGSVTRRRRPPAATTPGDRWLTPCRARRHRPLAPRRLARRDRPPARAQPRRDHGRPRRARALAAPQFLTLDNISQVAVLASIIAVAAVGEALVVITRNVDLSVEATIGLVAYCVAGPARAAHPRRARRDRARDRPRARPRDGQRRRRHGPPGPGDRRDARAR